MAINSRSDLIDFCKRQLGDGVINLEVSDDQYDDAIEMAIEFYRDYHFDGCERDYLVIPVTGTVLTVTSAAGFVVGEFITSPIYKLGAKITDIDTVNNKISIGRQVAQPASHANGVYITASSGFTVDETVTGIQSTASTAITSIDLGLTDKKYFETEESVMGVMKILNLTSVLASNTLFNSKYQFMLSEIQNLAAGQTQYLYGVMNYMAQLDFVLRKEKDYRFNRRMGRLYIDIDWDNDVFVGDSMVAEIYRYVDDNLFVRVLNDIWLKRYATALIKKQWGQNLSKYEGMTLPGGMTMNGKYILEQAIEEIKELEATALNQSAPLNFLVG